MLKITMLEPDKFKITASHSTPLNFLHDISIVETILISLQLSPAERDSAKRIHERMDQLSRAVGQTDDTLLVMLLYLRYATS